MFCRLKIHKEREYTMQIAFRAGFLRILLTALLAAAPVLASADVYKCVADNQTVTYSSTPCDSKKPTLAQPLPAPTTQTTVSSKNVSVVHNDNLEQDDSKPLSGKLGLDLKDVITIVLMILVPVALVTLMFMSRKSSSLTK
jgi:hypothetical protein